MDKQQLTAAPTDNTVLAVIGSHLRQDLSAMPDQRSKQHMTQRNYGGHPKHVDHSSDTQRRFAKATSDTAFETFHQFAIKPQNTCEPRSICGVTELLLHTLDLLPFCNILQP
jgi:hypothetical protein